MNRFTPSMVVDLVNRYGSSVSTDYYVNTARVESGFDADESTYEGNGTISIGLFQANAGEASEAGEDPSRLTDPDVNARVFIWHVERNAAYIRNFVDNMDPTDLGAYLGLAWNQGFGALQKTLQTYGYDFSAYRQRNAGNSNLTRALAYMDHVNFDASVPALGFDLTDVLAELGFNSGNDSPDAAGVIDPTIAAVALAIGALIWLG